MKITYMNEAVKLPVKKQSNVTLNDIQNAMRPIIKKNILSSINNDLILASKNFSSLIDMRIPVGINKNGDIDFSPSIIGLTQDKKSPDKYSVVITVASFRHAIMSTHENPTGLSETGCLYLNNLIVDLYLKLNKIFNDICVKNYNISNINIQPIWELSYNNIHKNTYIGDLPVSKLTKVVHDWAYTSICAKYHSPITQIIFDMTDDKFQNPMLYMKDIMEFIERYLTFNKSVTVCVFNNSGNSPNNVVTNTFEYICECCKHSSINFVYGYLYDIAGYRYNNTYLTFPVNRIQLVKKA